jgi:hypothetical protein
MRLGAAAGAAKAAEGAAKKAAAVATKAPNVWHRLITLLLSVFHGINTRRFQNSGNARHFSFDM